ncbi:hypothetical protein LTR27_006767 [Elasticomyces elasticus]|nr:hypothetical protein LTR27_006767 [Elasticomyces elasticus]
MHYAPALLALAGLAAAYRIPPLTTTEWCLAKCNDVGGDSCVAACVGNPNLSAEQIHAAHECEFKCHIPSKGAEGDLACLRACHKRYYYATTSTKAATSATTSGSLARRSDLAASTTMFSITVTGTPTPPLATPTAISLTPTEFCLGLCEPVYDEDLDEYDASCVAGCIGNPDLSSAQVAAADSCYSTCPRGDDDSVKDYNAYITCVRVCDTRYYSTISTKAATSTATSGGLARRSVTATTTTEVTSPTLTPSFSPTISAIHEQTTGCFESCARDDFHCQAACYGHDLPGRLPDQDAPRRTCEAHCRPGNGSKEEDWDYALCILGCDHTYYSTTTKAATTTATSGSLARRSGLAAADATTSLSTTTITPAMRSYTPSIPRPSPKEICLAFCTPRDLQCENECILARSPSPGEVATYQECDFACERFAIMEDDDGIYPHCFWDCVHSYDYPSTNTKASAIVATNAGLGPRTPLTAASPPWTPTSAAVPATHTMWPKEICMIPCGYNDFRCWRKCIEAPSPYPGPDAASQECNGACHSITIMAKDPGGLPDCLLVCAYSYDEVSTGDAQVTVTVAELGTRATLTAAATTPQLAQRSLIPVDLIPVSSDIEVSPKERCLTQCSPSDIACKARCVGVPNPSPAQIAATNKCEAACPQGNGTAVETQFYAACLQKCVDSFYFSGTGTIAAGITATSTSLPAGWSAKTTTMTSSTMVWPSVTLSKNSKIMFWQPAMTSSSSTGSAAGSTASSSPTGGPASSGSAPKFGQAGGLFGSMMAMLAL